MMQRTNHRRESSTGSFSSMNFCEYQNYFSSLDNFMNITKSMEDEVMVPSKLRDKNPVKCDSNKSIKENGKQNELHPTDLLDHYKFIRLIRNQLLSTKPFVNNLDEDPNNNDLLKHNQDFKKKYDNLKYHFNELMGQLDVLSNEAKAITELYRNDV